MTRTVRLDELLKGVDPASEGKVRKAIQQWRRSFHGFLADESRLKLQRGDARFRIPISVRPGYPVSLGRLQEVVIDEQAEHLAAVRQQIECCKGDLEILIPKMESLPGVPADELDYHQVILRSMKVNREYLEDALRKVVVKAVVRKMLEVDRDILGVYKHKAAKGEIVLYWAVIGFIAKSLGMEEEDLAAVVLVHELAHGYTHLGLDADGYQWKGFHEVRPGLAEALAQYYTHLAAGRNRLKAPGFWSAYQTLTQNQTDTYRHHLEWVDVWPPEVVRSVMLEARRQRLTDLSQFEPGLEREAKRLEEASL